MTKENKLVALGLILTIVGLIWMLSIHSDYKQSQLPEYYPEVERFDEDGELHEKLHTIEMFAQNAYMSDKIDIKAYTECFNYIQLKINSLEFYWTDEEFECLARDILAAIEHYINNGSAVSFFKEE